MTVAEKGWNMCGLLLFFFFQPQYWEVGKGEGVLDKLLSGG
jgi:hypothetical protein